MYNDITDFFCEGDAFSEASSDEEDADTVPKNGEINAVFTIDSEWGKDESFLTLQILVQIRGHNNLLFVYFNADHQSVFDENQNQYFSGYHKRIKGSPTPVFVPWKYTQKGDNMIFNDVIIRISEKLGFTNQSINNIQLNFFFSVMDLYYLFSIDFISGLFEKKFKKIDYITKKNALFGIFYSPCNTKKIILHDYSGLEKSLEGLLSVFNITHPLKSKGVSHLLQKDNMEYSLINQFETFLDYAILDVLTLSKVEYKIVEKINHIRNNILNLSDKDNLFVIPCQKMAPTTIGRVVNDLLLSFIDQHFINAGGNDLLSKFQHCNKKVALTTNNLKRRKKKGGEIISNLTSGAGIKAFITMFSENTGVYNSFTQGGRCSNEEYLDYIFETCAADIDFASCYGSALNSFDFPIGLPSVIAFTKDSKTMTLKEFLEVSKSELVPNKYQIIVSGLLSFRQTLIYSKVITTEALKRKIEKTNNEMDIGELSNFDAGEHIILTHQIENGVITSDIISILESICTNQEYSEILNLEVVTASLYKKSDYVENAETFLQHIENDLGGFIYNEKTQSNHDNRSHIVII